MSENETRILRDFVDVLRRTEVQAEKLPAGDIRAGVMDIISDTRALLVKMDVRICKKQPVKVGLLEEIEDHLDKLAELL